MNFNAALKRLFGHRCGLDRELSIALQFARIDAAQRCAAAAHLDLPKAVQSFNAAFEGALSDEEYNDPAYAYRVALVPVTTNNRRKADEVFEIVDRDSPEAEAVNIVLRDRERRKLRETDVLGRAREAGFPRFTSHCHRKLARRLDARNPGKGFGVNVFGRWLWYEPWVEVVLKHCGDAGDRYRTLALEKTPGEPQM